MAWAMLVVAGLFEVGWAIGLKYTEGFTRLWPTVGTVIAMIISLGLLGVAMKSLPVGTSYAVWVGVGAVGTAILGIVLLGESANAGRLLSLALIVAGIVGLKLCDTGMTSTRTAGHGPGLVVMYRWRLHPGMEASFVESWSRSPSCCAAQARSVHVSTAAMTAFGTAMRNGRARKPGSARSPSRSTPPQPPKCVPRSPSRFRRFCSNPLQIIWSWRMRSTPEASLGVGIPRASVRPHAVRR